MDDKIPAKGCGVPTGEAVQQQLRSACREGRLDALRHMIEHAPRHWRQPPLDVTRDDNGAVRDAILAGQLEIVRYLVEEAPKFGQQRVTLRQGICWAVAAGHLPIVRYLVEEAPRHGQKLIDVTFDHNYAVFNAASEGRLDIVRYLVEEAPQFGQQPVDLGSGVNGAIASAIEEQGVLFLMRYLVDLARKRRWASPDGEAGRIDRTTECAARASGFGTLRYLLEEAPRSGQDLDDLGSCSAAICEMAVRNEDLEAVRYLVEVAAPAFPLPLSVTLHARQAISDAAEHGRLELVRYLLEEAPRHGQPAVNGCFSGAIATAAEHRHLGVIRYLVEEAPQFGTITVDVNDDDNAALWFAASLGFTEIVKYLVEETPKFDQKPVGFISHDDDNDGTSLVRTAAINGQLEIVKYLVEEVPFVTGEILELTERECLGINESIREFLRSKAEFVAALQVLKASGTPWPEWRRHLALPR